MEKKFHWLGWINYLKKKKKNLSLQLQLADGDPTNAISFYDWIWCVALNLNFKNPTVYQAIKISLTLNIGSKTCSKNESKGPPSSRVNTATTVSRGLDLLLLPAWASSPMQVGLIGGFKLPLGLNVNVCFGLTAIAKLWLSIQSVPLPLLIDS